MKESAFDRVGKSLEPLLKKGVNREIFTAAAAGIYMHAAGVGKKRIITAGKTRNDSAGIPVNKETLFDLASLTKPLCSVLSLLCLIEKNKLSFAEKAANLLPFHFPSYYRNITLAQLMSHSAGLKAYKPFYKGYAPVYRRRSSENFIKKILLEKLQYSPGSQCVYSDLGYILLGAVIEEISGVGLDQFFKREIAAILGIEGKIMFRTAADHNSRAAKNIAATEKCPWRGRILQGEVHDEHSWLLNGVAGHAGLFGSIEGVLSLGEMILEAWQGRKPFAGFRRSLLEQTLSRHYAKQTWCLGFDTPTAGKSSGGSLISPHSVGHLGFTGTSFWIDPERDIVIVLLSNRVHPTRNNEAIKKFRPLFHDAVFKALAAP